MFDGRHVLRKLAETVQSSGGAQRAKLSEEDEARLKREKKERTELALLLEEGKRTQTSGRQVEGKMSWIDRLDDDRDGGRGGQTALQLS